MPIDRTSRPEPQANGPHLSASGYSEKQCRPPCRSPRERRPEDQTTDAMDIEVPETRFRGRSQALLYNEVRPHSSLGYLTPKFASQRANAASRRATGPARGKWSKQGSPSQASRGPKKQGRSVGAA